MVFHYIQYQMIHNILQLALNKKQYNNSQWTISPNWNISFNDILWKCSFIALN